MQRNKKEYYIDFITKYIKINPNAIISSNKLYTLFCSIYDLNPKHFDIKSFTPIFIKTYESLKNDPIKKTFRRLYIGENPVTCFLDISLVHFNNVETVNKQSTSTVLTTNEQTTNDILLETSFKTIKLENVMTENKQTIKPLNTNNNVDLDEFLDYFEPGTEHDPIILTQEFFILYNQIYKNSLKHKKLIPHVSNFKTEFKKYWDSKYPNNKLKEARKKNERGYKFIKRVK